MVELEGIVERITYYNEENFFTVARVQVRDTDEIVTAVGYFPSLEVGEVLRLRGRWVMHEKHGCQLKIESYETLVPATVREIENYLASGAIKGIGPATAKKIVERFGENTLEIMSSSPHRLMEIAGIGQKRLEMIVRSFAEQKETREIMLFLQQYGIGPGVAVKVYKAYKEKAIEVVKQNPYRLADEVYGIGFKTADKIARMMGIEMDSPERLAAGVKYALHRAADEGHVFLPEKELLKRASSLMEVDEDRISEVLPALEEKGDIVADGPPEKREVYLAPFYVSEKSVARKLFLLAGLGETRSLEVTPEEISEIEERCGIKLAARQREAIEKAASSGVLVITGGPGTGKTTVIRCLIEFFQGRNLKVVLAAPTGRAAKRMTEATGMEAKTIHRLLEYKAYGEGGMAFGRNRDNPLDEDVVIIDETSMVDIIMMHHLLSALKPFARLVLVGDKDQLPSVGPGSVLREIIDSGRIPVVMLDEIFRQARESMIVVNAHRINRGLFPYLNVKGRDFYFEQAVEPEEVLNKTLDLVCTRLPRFGGYDPMEDIQVITPMKKTPVGVLSLNLQLQERLNPPAPGKKEFPFRSFVFREGDRVMQIKNNYEKEVFNGDLGRIVEIDEDEGVLVSFPDARGERTLIYAGEELEELSLAYALSVHKSQGSEFPVVVMPVTTQHFVMLQRNLLYTAITRARKLMVLVGSKEALAIAVRNSRAAMRYSRLAERIAREFEESLL
ncbi:SF1B family DNA helicase RecD2 [Thermosediminibacter oceani]|uniref:ATP-dependent RecD2 DNA helicase n=1 Tax=Thermosediminibacter oceani (strain ATCC BAA-1034 / DSM 16646 / JW/IW-1228P) TaxID=555079 RepID=D9S0Z0_THEOJ|nr:ATP-dependent RecD-like DNA helicase [Thermosediminibacter oceani]ADL07154.1 helicase, RecD/TraA family [Thermosediminibacter oceani DSM 16646]